MKSRLVHREDRGVPLRAALIPGMRLMLQPLCIGGEVFNLVVPADVDAIMDAYIAAGTGLAVTNISSFANSHLHDVQRRRGRQPGGAR